MAVCREMAVGNCIGQIWVNLTPSIEEETSTQKMSPEDRAISRQDCRLIN